MSVGMMAPAWVRAGQTEAVIVVSVSDVVPVTFGRAEVPGIIVPGAAAQDPPLG